MHTALCRGISEKRRTGRAWRHLVHGRLNRPMHPGDRGARKVHQCTSQVVPTRRAWKPRLTVSRRVSTQTSLLMLGVISMRSGHLHRMFRCQSDTLSIPDSLYPHRCQRAQIPMRRGSILRFHWSQCPVHRRDTRISVAQDASQPSEFCNPAVQRGQTAGGCRST